MRMAFLIFRYFPYGGLQRNFLEIANLCCARGHEVTVFTMKWAGTRPVNFLVNVVHVPGFSNHRRALRFVENTAPLLSKDNFDVVVGFNKMPGLDLYYAGDTCYVERISSKYPSWKAACLRLSPRYDSFQWLESQVFSPLSSTRILLLSEKDEQYYRHHYKTQQERLTVLPPGISLDRKASVRINGTRAEVVRKQLGIRKAQRIILLVGSAFKTKGLDRAIYAFHSLPESLKQSSCLVAIGDTRVAPFQKLARRLNLQDHVIFLPPRESVWELMEAADLLLHPSLCDSGGGVLLEAMVAGLPVLTTDTCGYARYVMNAAAGRVLPSPFKQGGLNTALHEMMTSAERKTWSENGRTFAAQHNFEGRNLRVVEMIEQTGRGLRS